MNISVKTEDYGLVFYGLNILDKDISIGEALLKFDKKVIKKVY